MAFLLEKGITPVVPCMRITVYTTKKDLEEGRVHKDNINYDEVKNDPRFVSWRVVKQNTSVSSKKRFYPIMYYHSLVR